MLEKLKARLAELRSAQAGGVEFRSFSPKGTYEEEIETLEGQIAAYTRLADLANKGKVAKTRNV